MGGLGVGGLGVVLGRGEGSLGGEEGGGGGRVLGFGDSRSLPPPPSALHTHPGK